MRQEVIYKRGVRVKDFHCADCEKDFLRKDNLIAHIQTADQNMVHLQRAREERCGNLLAPSPTLKGMSRMNTTRRSYVHATGNYEELQQQFISTFFEHLGFILLVFSTFSEKRACAFSY